MKPSNNILYLILYSFVVSLSICAFVIFRPFSHIDNNHSGVFCHTDKLTYETSPNLIFAVGDKLDPFNDKKVKKLCQYRITRDYGDIYKAPQKINYTFLPALMQESSWPNALFAGLMTFGFGSFVIEILWKAFKKKSYFGSQIWNFFLYLINE